MERFATLAREFPDFDIATLPAIPDDWQDTSWHNDTCPSFEVLPQWHVYIDYADTALREFPDSPTRFSLQAVRADGESFTLLDTNDWQAVLDRVDLQKRIPSLDATDAVTMDKVRLAREFGSAVQEELSRADFRAVLELNRNDSIACHTHDFFDANMLMLEAFKVTFEREPEFLSNPDETADLALWNDAWQIAKAAEFFA
ncbi:hypothetical protein L905_24050 [Agrobacterium sp. TS43]|uniref:hypothetical protein n=1 Tax=Agrobacterium TaxID=357 RepID=UPI00068C32E0|nr:MULTISPECIES: hypothetical protein [Agrobacterium]KVK43594.1 hypothetical protein L904_27065 [Agrobacterium sp. LY4]KVK43625.1 hypothetical protein L903_27090 [Agrobacterium sp. JL28]KVK57607.1 hypothetical protein L906_26990 [Agrobacterium sp. TS45]KVK58052.1 hypothetical protein L905_24050 [Agrobacterium sp. TS43]KVK61009.1 hypothetical protein L907_26870 [Agrobacterium sp. C13]